MCVYNKYIDWAASFSKKITQQCREVQICVRILEIIEKIRINRKLHEEIEKKIGNLCKLFDLQSY